MEIIQKTEKAPRGVYCGTIGILLPKGKRIFNVAIRTLQMQGDQAIYGVGGGITWDSQWESEYPVSYTHLDVYKRQVHPTLSNLRATNSCCSFLN